MGWVDFFSDPSHVIAEVVAPIVRREREVFHVTLYHVSSISAVLTCVHAG